MLDEDASVKYVFSLAASISSACLAAALVFSFRITAANMVAPMHPMTKRGAMPNAITWVAGLDSAMSSSAGSPTKGWETDYLPCTPTTCN